MSATLPAKMKRSRRRVNSVPLPAGTEWTAVRMELGKCLTDEELLRFSAQHREWRIEQTAEGELIIMPPTFGDTSNWEAELTADFVVWARGAGGKVFNASAGFKLPNGAILGPDVSWLSQASLDALPESGLHQFVPCCPDFVLELRSSSDRIPTLQRKMAEYIGNGARLGWLIDPLEKQVFIYHPDQPVEHRLAPATLSGEPVLPGFTLDLARVW